MRINLWGSAAGIGTLIAMIATLCPGQASAQTAGITTPGTNAFQDAGYSYLDRESFFYIRSVQSIRIDEGQGVAYLSALGDDGSGLVKVDLGAGSTLPFPIGQASLSGDEDLLGDMALDLANGIGLVGTLDSPAKIVKVSLGATRTDFPQRVAATYLDPGDSELRCAAFDTINGYAYFATATSPARLLKIDPGAGSSAPAKVASLDISGTISSAQEMLFDATNGYLYISSEGGVIGKYQVTAGSAAPVFVGSVSTGRQYTRSGDIDATRGYAYFVDQVTNATLMKIRLDATPTAPVVVATRSLGSDRSFSVLVDETNGTILVGRDEKVSKYAVGAGDATPTFVADTTLAAGEDEPFFSAFNEAEGKAYFMHYGAYFLDESDKIIEVESGGATSAATRIGATSLPWNEGNLTSVAYDSANGYGFFGATSSLHPGKIIKVDLNPGTDAPPRRVSALEVNTLPAAPSNLGFDSTRGLGYATVQGNGTDARFVKFDPGVGDAAPSIVSELQVASSGISWRSAAIYDFDNNYAYLLPWPTSGQQLLKVDLGTSYTTPLLLHTIAMPTGVGVITHTALDEVNNIGYFGTDSNPARLIKVNLGSGAATPVVVGTLALPTLCDDTSHLSVDPVDGYALMGTFFGTAGVNTTRSTTVHRILLGAPGDVPTYDQGYELAADELHLFEGFLDRASDEGWFRTARSIVRVDTGGATGPFVRQGQTYTMPYDTIYRSMFTDGLGYIYAGAGIEPSSVIKYKAGASSPKNTLWGTNITIPTNTVALVDEMRFYSHVAGGNYQFAIYRVDSGYDLLWKSGIVSNTATEGEIAVPISSGTPSELSLSTGTYAVAWITDSDTLAASAIERPAQINDAFAYRTGAFQIPGNADFDWKRPIRYAWTQYITYTAAPSIETLILSDLDGLNSPDTGYTNSLTVQVEATTTGTLPIIDFEASQSSATGGFVSVGANPSFQFTFSNFANGSKTLWVRAITAQGAGPVKSATITYDSVAPTVTLTIDGITGTGPTNAASFTGSVSGSGLRSGSIDFENASEFTVTNGTVVATGANTFSITPAGDGDVVITVLAGAASDQAGNTNASPVSRTITVDRIAPSTTIASSLLWKVTGSITGSYSASDGSGTGVASTRLFYRKDSGNWTAGSTFTGGTWSYTPTGGSPSGSYAFTAISTDAAGNAESANPTGSADLPGQVTVVFNSANDSTFTWTLSTPGTYLYPMTDSVAVEATFDTVDVGGQFSFRRSTNSVAATHLPDGYALTELVPNRLVATNSFLAETEVDIRWIGQNPGTLALGEIDRAVLAQTPSDPGPVVRASDAVTTPAAINFALSFPTGQSVVYAGRYVEPTFDSIALQDADALNDPLAGWTNQATINAFLGNRGGDLPQGVEVALEPTFSAAQTPAYTLGDGVVSATLAATEGEQTVYVRPVGARGASSAVLSQSMILDTIAPVTNVSIPTGVFGTSGTIQFNVDSTSTPASDMRLRLDYRPITGGGPWVTLVDVDAATQATGMATINRPAEGDGLYAVRVFAADPAGNLGTIPFPGLITHPGVYRVTFNSSAGTPLQLTVAAGTSVTFPLSATSFVTIDGTNLSADELITLQRISPLGTVPTSISAVDLISEYLQISSATPLNGTVDLTWQFDPAADAALTNPVNTVYRFSAGVLSGTFAVTPSGPDGNILTVTGVSAFSDWYAGDNTTGVTGWGLLGEN
ncbi:hypothetical protein GC173_12455 [bacterium]|nr:hypothetical protein [bacterium]